MYVSRIEVSEEILRKLRLHLKGQVWSDLEIISCLEEKKRSFATESAANRRILRSAEKQDVRIDHGQIARYGIPRLCPQRHHNDKKRNLSNRYFVFCVYPRIIAVFILTLKLMDRVQSFEINFTATNKSSWKCDSSSFVVFIKFVTGKMVPLSILELFTLQSHNLWVTCGGKLINRVYCLIS